MNKQTLKIRILFYMFAIPGMWTVSYLAWITDPFWTILGVGAIGGTYVFWISILEDFKEIKSME